MTELVDAVSNKDDEIAELVIEDQPIEPQALKAAIRRLTCKLELVPVLCGSAFRKRGVQPLVDAVVDYLPSPLDIPAIEGVVKMEMKEFRAKSPEPPMPLIILVPPTRVELAWA